MPIYKKISNFLKKLKDKIREKRREINKLRGADELFSNGKIFQAKDKELDKILGELSTAGVGNETIRHREIIRAITVLSLKNHKATASAQSLNVFLSIIVVVLTFYTLYLTSKQTNYTELSTRAERIEQAKSIQAAKDRCKQTPELNESGLYEVDTGKPAPCSQVLSSKLLQ